MTTGTHEYEDDPRNAGILISVNGALEAARRRPSSPSSIPASCSATASGRGCASIDGGIAFLEEHLDRLYEGAKAIDMDIGLSRAALVAAALRLPQRQRDARRRACPPDGDARREAHALSGPAPHDRAGDDRHHPRIQAAEAGDRRARHHALHRACPPHRPGRAGPEAELAFQAELRPRLHPGDEGRRRRGADARSGRLRRDLQLHALLHRAEGRALDLARPTTASAASRAATS